MELKPLPSGMKDIVLEQFVEFNNKYKRIKDIHDLEDSNEDKRFISEVDYLKEMYCHYARIDSSSIDESNTELLIEVIKAASVLEMEMYREICEINACNVLELEFQFINRTWVIQSPITIDKPQSINVEQFDLAQSFALILTDFHEGKGEALYDLCALYFRPKGSEFEGLKKEVVSLMKCLPLHMAFCVKKYVEDTLQVYGLLLKQTKIGNDDNQSTSDECSPKG